MRTFVDLYEAASAARLAAGAARQAAADKQQKRLKTAKLATKAAQQLKSVKSQPASSGPQRDPKVVAALKNVPVSKKPTPGKESQQFVDKTKSAMQSGQKADAAAAKKQSLAAKMERKKNLQAKKTELQKKKKAGEEKKAKINTALAKATSGPRASSGSSMETGGASADKAALQSAGQAASGAASAASTALGLDKKMERLRKNIGNRLNPKRKKGLATGAASTGRNEMRNKSTKPADPWKKTPKDSDPWKEEFSHWREEFIFEVDDKVPTKKEKTIQPMSGKNTIIINPDSMQEAHKKDHTYLETDMKKRKKNNEKAIADMKKVKDDTVPRWMREGSDWRSELGLEEGVLDDALKTDKKMGELHKKVDNDVKRMKAGKKFKEEVEQVEELTDLQRRRYLGRKPGESKERLKTSNERKDKKAALAAMMKQYKGMKAGIYSSYEPEGEQLQERPYQVMGYDKEGGKEKKVGKPVKSKKYADARASELSDTHKATGGKYRSEYTEEFVDEAKKGLWDNIHARRKAGKPKRKPGDKNYPETLNVEGVMPASIDPAKHRVAQKATKIRNLMKGAATAGEKEAARRKTRGPALAGEHYDWRGELGEGAAWTKKSGKSEAGGLNEKGRKSYEGENPGSDLKAPSKKVGNPRRASFCARMKGMKSKLTSKKTASDPDSRINKSLRAWNC
jgi:hypothetical protein